MADDSPLTFPCRFPIKALGYAHEDMDATVASIVRRHVPDLGEGAVRSRTSRGGRYTAVTVTIEAKSREQLDTLYRDLNACQQLLIVL